MTRLTKHETKRKNRKREIEERAARVLRHRDKIYVYRALMATYEQMDSDAARSEVRRIKTCIRTLEQQLRYISHV
jgi:division protein CdvB (Snf7/Vps24/ESCRT-III family)